MPKRVRIALILVVLLVLNSVALLLTFGPSQGGGEALADPRGDDPPNAPAAIENRRRHVQSHIADVASEPVPMLIQNLIDTSAWFSPAGLSGQEMAQRCWHVVLGNRRCSRLSEELAAMPPHERDTLLEEAFRTTFGMHQDTFDRALTSYETPGAPKNEQSALATQLGVCCSLFLIAEHRELDELLDRIDAVQRFGEEVRNRIKSSEAIPPAVQFVANAHVEPDNAFYISVVLDAVPAQQRDQLIAAADLNGVGTLKEIELTTWNAEPGTFDSVHAWQGLPVDRTGGTETKTAFEWDGERLMDHERQQDVVQQLLAAARALK
ncbi:hypothetical protein Mal4_17860 [Maioricimonas rarisocia]|uniref:Uncharacterized protein n=1 Tax=Maioricimonas rarisocia TaxID=2528026 RepID=A0A517Z4Q4_9PLAN|nr:hypothetical protein [Maioricimonas rarisocia]QDU37472.1 hypothetical protein Mal4_17860 [Maioricimonas rarisocia]